MPHWGQNYGPKEHITRSIEIVYVQTTQYIDASMHAYALIAKVCVASSLCWQVAVSASAVARVHGSAAGKSQAFDLVFSGSGLVRPLQDSFEICSYAHYIVHVYIELL